MNPQKKKKRKGCENGVVEKWLLRRGGERKRVEKERSRGFVWGRDVNCQGPRERERGAILYFYSYGFIYSWDFILSGFPIFQIFTSHICAVTFFAPSLLFTAVTRALNDSI